LVKLIRVGEGRRVGLLNQENPHSRVRNKEASIMYLFAASYIINDEKSKFVTMTLARTGTALKPEIHIGKHKDDKVIISHGNWKEFTQHFNHTLQTLSTVN
jgi:hypothetical protein